MRVDSKFSEFLKEQVLLKDKDAIIFLFGSRLHNDLKGGDFDFLILSDHISFTKKLDLLVALKLKFGEQKIDLLVYPHSAILSNPFVKELLTSAKKL